MVNTLFVNSGILGQRTFAAFVDEAFVGEREGVCGTQVVLADGLTPLERVRRRVVCTRLWPDGLAGARNLDRFRFRAEVHAGLLARDRIRALERAGDRFQVLHFHRQATAYASLRRMRRTPSIVSIDCTQRCVLDLARSEAERRSYLPNVRRDGEVFRAARLIVSTSRWAAESVRAMYPDCATPIEVMPNPVLLDHFDAGWAALRAARAAEPGYRPRVLFMGGDFARKGGGDLLDAWRDAALGERASLDLVTHRAVAAADGVPGVRVHTGVAARSERWRALWRGADLFVLPTRDEAFGTVFQEAAAAGLPTIGTRINAVPEIVVEGETGVLVDAGDRVALARALGALAASSGMRGEMGERARARIARVADPGAYRDRLAAAIRRLAEA